MLQTKTCALSTCRVEFQTDNSRKTHCTRQHATLDRVRRWKAKQRNGGGGGGNGGGGGGAPTLFDTIDTVDPQAIYVPDTCYRTPLVRKPSLTERPPRLVAA